MTVEGLADAAVLAAALPPDSYLVSSNEAKAWQTLGGGGAGIVRDVRFNEVNRVGEPWDARFREKRSRYVDGEEHAGWESHQDVAARFDEGVDHHRTIADGRPLVIASHGMALTTWLVSCGAVAPVRAPEFWRGLTFPDCLLLGPDDNSVEVYPWRSA